MSEKPKPSHTLTFANQELNSANMTCPGSFHERGSSTFWFMLLEQIKKGFKIQSSMWKEASQPSRFLNGKVLDMEHPSLVFHKLRHKYLANIWTEGILKADEPFTTCLCTGVTPGQEALRHMVGILVKQDIFWHA